MKYLRPHKLKPLNRDALIVSKYLFDLLKQKKEIKLNDTIKYLKKELKINEKPIIFAINFLFAFDKIEYHLKKDTLRLKNEI